MSRFGLHVLDLKLLRDFRRLWGQLLAAALVLAAGVTVLVMTQNLFQTLSATQDAYYDRYRFADVFASVRRAPVRLEADIAAIDGVRTVDLSIHEYARLDMPGLIEPASALLVSTPRVGEPRLNSLILSQGRWPEPGRLDEAIVSNEFAAAWGLNPGAHVTAIMNGQRRPLRIVGIGQSPEFIYAIAPGDLLPQHERFAILWMARDSLEQSFDLDGAFNTVSLKLERGASERAVIDALDDILEDYGGTGAYGREDQLSHAFLEGEITQNRVSGRLLPPVFLGVAAFMLHVAISRLIDTEREQIGLLKAFGYANGAVAAHYMKLALAPGLVGGLGGAAFGTWSGVQVAQIYGEFYNLPFILVAAPWSGYAIGVAISLGACISGALLAVRKAVTLDPAVAMRPPAPAKFTRGWADALGLVRAMSGPARIILRNVSRTPLRSGLTTLGVAAGCGMMIAGTFMFESMDKLMDVQFVVTDRSDVTVSFPIEQPLRVVHAVRNMPGVVHVQPAHIVPVEITADLRTERLALAGLPQDAELFRPVDRELRPLRIPEHGVVLSRYLAEALDLSLGDPVRMTVLGGRRPEIVAPLSGLVDDYIAAYAYMDIAALARALMEAPSASMIYVRLDTADYERFFEEVRDSAVIQSTSVRALIIDKFRETLNQNIAIFTTLFYLFAGSICFGVIYNAARISLSERARELASLRVLGFTRGEASYVLLGELALLVALALPIGCAIGYGLAWAMITSMFDADLMRPPLLVTAERYATAILFTSAFALISGLIVRRRIDRLDLVEVLKTRE